jgi:N-acetylglucosamine-6-sulfatase
VVPTRPRLTEAQILAIEELRQQRLESLLAVDEGVEQVVETLRASGELANTLILFTSDNGFMQGEHRIPPDRGKGSAYEQSVRVPLVMRGPGIRRGRVEDVVANVDLAPTILAAAQATPGRVLDGQSLLPLVRGGLANFGRDLLLASTTFNAIRTDRYVYVAHGGGAKELYDLGTDPHQLRSRHDDPALRRIRDELARRLAGLRRCSGAVCRRGPRVGLRLAANARRSVRATIAGSDAEWVAAARFYVNGAWAGVDTRPPFGVVFSPSRLRTPVSTVRAFVRTRDGRSVSLTRPVPPELMS